MCSSVFTESDPEIPQIILKHLMLNKLVRQARESTCSCCVVSATMNKFPIHKQPGDCCGTRKLECVVFIELKVKRNVDSCTSQCDVESFQIKIILNCEVCPIV